MSYADLAIRFFERRVAEAEMLLRYTHHSKRRHALERRLQFLREELQMWREVKRRQEAVK